MQAIDIQKYFDRFSCRRYGIRPTGNAGYKTSWITSSIVFPAIAPSLLSIVSNNDSHDIPIDA
ncbi:hypothetical protein [Nostoc sp. ChiSLP03a]|uniref:hypothetical protein n=1 Tax=Nostoc sp. ChiSLP03a TaxID=3075380 RepID=UPI002AD2EFFE|nr:hypothetical protein [Nostoc sp. ChiSLP03a]MDZ8212141.1 hypothetical protein [Nostoc sp. ChiSLP03a]